MEFHRGRIGPTLRLALARRPWIRWAVAALTASGAGWLVLGQLSEVDAARSAWVDRQVVLVAEHDHAPGDTLVVQERELPTVAIPAGAIADIAPGTRTRQHISVGEVVTAVDVGGSTGPAAAAAPGEVVVPVDDSLLDGALASLGVGLDVAVHAEGLVLASAGRVVALDGNVVFIAVPSDDAAAVSAAAQRRGASIVFLP